MSVVLYWYWTSRTALMLSWCCACSASGSVLVLVLRVAQAPQATLDVSSQPSRIRYARSPHLRFR